ncbi:hypothetical protein CI238_07130 [Colletotrichum incanum]|uniref:Zn(2)-C6 fungal-type domain-containing protein n=1 Tax=Colletotrichum incanum TaxID=1573173 RepID=A0A162NLS2_COLIC|nr:hypothetical protein CI238_07130 [Colletotrichum incanum]
MPCTMPVNGLLPARNARGNSPETADLKRLPIYSDTLQRHMLVHATEQMDKPVRSSAEPDFNNRNRAKKGPSCAACRRSKQRCNGAMPCHRCERQSRPCHYHPKRSRQRISVPRGSQHQQAHESTSELTSSDVTVALIHAVGNNPNEEECTRPPGLSQSTTQGDVTTIDGFSDDIPQGPFADFSRQTAVEGSSMPTWADFTWPWLLQGADCQYGLLSSSNSQAFVEQFGSLQQEITGWPFNANDDDQSIRDQLCTTTSVAHGVFPPSYPPLITPNLETANTGLMVHTDTNTSVPQFIMPLSHSNAGHQSKEPEGHHQAPIEQVHENARDWEDADISIDVEDTIPDNEQYCQGKRLSQVAYEKLCVWMDATRVANVRMAMRLRGCKSLPDQYLMNSFIQLYLEKFHDLLPIIHKPTFHPSSAPVLLVLAIACIGSRYSTAKEAPAFASEVSDLLGGVISDMVDEDEEDVAQVWFGQCAILNQVAVSFTCQKPMCERSHYTRFNLNVICQKIDCFSKMDAPPGLRSVRQSDIEDAWARWIKWEARKRVAYGTWFRLFFDLQTLTSAEWLQSPLPCHERSWEATDALSWSEQYRKGPELGTLRRELERLYRQTDMVKDLGQFSFLLLLLGCFRDMLFLREAGKSGLSLVLNCDGKPVLGQSELLNDEDCWKMLNPARRSRSGNMEHLLFQHYYSVGILFHFRFGDLLAFSGWRVSKSKEIETRMRLSTWVLGNGEDARTAVSHAGRLFGLLRDHPCHGYHEPPAAFLASLCLWVYSMSESSSLLGPFGRCLSAKCESQQISEQTKDITLFRIDQDSGIKLTKDWVSRGCHIRCFLGGVGSLHKPEFRGLVLDQGIRLISSLNHWKTGEPLAGVLRRQVK